MGPIDLLDDFFETKIYDELLNYTDKIPMFYGSKSNVKTDPYAHWVSNFSRTTHENKTDSAPNLPYQIYDAWKPVRSVLTNKSLITCYMNGHTYGVEGYFHTDSNEENCTTVLVYLVRGEWNPDWGGETVFIDDKNQIQASIFPKANRVVVFPSNLNHCARGVTRMYPGLRKTLIFKTRRDSA